MLKEIILKEIIKGLLKSSAKYAKELYDKFGNNEYFDIKLIHEKTPECVENHIKYASTWASDISLYGFSSPKETLNNYITLNLNLAPRKWNLTSSKPESISVKDLIAFESNVVILGDPGAGKSTTFK